MANRRNIFPVKYDEANGNGTVGPSNVQVVRENIDLCDSDSESELE